MLVALSLLPCVRHQGTCEEGMKNLEGEVSYSCLWAVVFGEGKHLQLQSVFHLVHSNMFSFGSVLVVHY